LACTSGCRGGEVVSWSYWLNKAMGGELLRNQVTINNNGPLSKLTDNIEFVWESRKQISFQLLREICSAAVEMHSWDFPKPARSYCNANIKENEYTIIHWQIHVLPESPEPVEIPIIYEPKNLAG